MSSNCQHLRVHAVGQSRSTCSLPVLPELEGLPLDVLLCKTAGPEMPLQGFSIRLMNLEESSAELIDKSLCRRRTHSGDDSGVHEVLLKAFQLQFLNVALLSAGI